VDALLRALAREPLLLREPERLALLRPEREFVEALRDRDFDAVLRDRELADFRAVERPPLFFAVALFRVDFRRDPADDELRDELRDDRVLALRAARPVRPELRARPLELVEPRPALRDPLCAARAVSRETSLLKLLRWPRAVLSCTSSARPRSSNFSNQSFQSMCSSDCCPL
jgi:hypothetical protein